MERAIIDFLKMNDVEYKESIRLSTISPIRIGGCAEIVAYPNSEEQLTSLICFLENKKLTSISSCFPYPHSRSTNLEKQEQKKHS